MRLPNARSTAIAFALAICLFAASATARAQTAVTSTASDDAASGQARAADTQAADAGPVRDGTRTATGLTSAAVTFLPAPPAQRPPVLVPLYVSFGTLQALDVASTLRAIDRGGAEANPLMRGAVGSPAAMVALKAGITGLAVYSSEKLWKEHRAAAILMMVAFNGAYAAVVAHNYSVAAR